MSETAGALLFARYAYPPNALGLCGAESPRTLLEYGDAAESDGGLAELARTFDGAWPYLALIAESNRIESPLDARVVEAYWVGNELLEHVDAASLARHVRDRFRGRIGRAEEQVVDAVAHGALPHHSFHVFAVYPWLGLLRTGVVEQPLHILDRCRVTPALVESVADGSAVVLAQPLEWDGRRLRLGEPEPRTAHWSAGGGLAFVHGLAAGDRVALHWDFVCDRLTAAGESALRWATARALRAVNAGATPAELFA